MVASGAGELFFSCACFFASLFFLFLAAALLSFSTGGGAPTTVLTRGILPAALDNPGGGDGVDPLLLKLFCNSFWYKDEATPLPLPAPPPLACGGR